MQDTSRSKRSAEDPHDSSKARSMRALARAWGHQGKGDLFFLPLPNPLTMGYLFVLFPR